MYGGVPAQMTGGFSQIPLSLFSPSGGGGGQMTSSFAAAAMNNGAQAQPPSAAMANFDASGNVIAATKEFAQLLGYSLVSK
jgi:hypothetical protein